MTSRQGPGEDNQPPYPGVLGSAYAGLPRAVRNFHEAGPGIRRAGRADIRRGSRPLARLAAWVGGFPPAGRDVPLSVTVHRINGRETWVRDYAGHRMASRQHAGSGRWSGLVVERFGVVRIGMEPIVEGGALRLVVRRWSVLGLPLPLAFAPGGDIRETEVDGRYAFHVEVGSPLTGPIVAYEGWLEPGPGER